MIKDVGLRRSNAVCCGVLERERHRAERIETAVERSHAPNRVIGLKIMDEQFA